MSRLPSASKSAYRPLVPRRLVQRDGEGQARYFRRTRRSKLPISSRLRILAGTPVDRTEACLRYYADCGAEIDHWIEWSALPLLASCR